VARALAFELDKISKGETELREPAYQLLLYDVRSTTDTIRDIVVGNLLQEDTGPFDITDFVVQGKVQEQAGSYASDGVASSQIGLTVIDPNGRFDPLRVRSDPTIEGRFFRSGNVLRLIEGDNQVAVEDWAITFTGELLGQAGYDRNSTTGSSTLTLKAVGREATFINYIRTSEEFLLDTSYIAAATSVAVNEMGLDNDEIAFPTFGSQLIPHKVVQLVEENPMTMLARIMFLDSIIPRFNGEGKLSAVSDRATGNAARIYINHNAIKTIVRPASDVQPPNTVCVVGLDSNLTRNDMPRQALATLDITTGYFTPPERVEVFWRDDRTLMADNVVLKVFVSVNGGLNVLGGGETIDLIASGDPDQVGVVGIYLESSTGFAPWLMVFLLATYVGLSLIPDKVITFGLFGSTGVTIPLGRLAQAIALGAALLVMSKIGRGSYAFVGDPFEYVYAEIRRCAKVAGVGEFDENQLTLENHLVSTAAQADATAFEMLFRVQAEKQPRTITMLHDIGLEPNDIFEFEDDGSRYLAHTISRTLTRDPKKTQASVTCFEVTSDVSLGT
jgi:hypothetical protein